MIAAVCGMTLGYGHGGEAGIWLIEFEWYCCWVSYRRICLLLDVKKRFLFWKPRIVMVNAGAREIHAEIDLAMCYLDRPYTKHHLFLMFSCEIAC